MPLRADLDLAVMCLARILHDASHSMLVRGQRVTEFPEGVALEIEAWRVGDGMLDSWVWFGGMEGNVPTRNRFRHGRWRDFQFSQALRNGVRGFGDDMFGLLY